MPLRDPAKFFSVFRTTLGSGFLNQGQVAGTTAILSAWDQWASGSDIRFVAYSLATTWHETAATMLPIEEYGHGRGRAYGVPAGPWHQIFDGRGDVQLTWEANYRKATVELRKREILTADQDLERTPALAMNPNIAAPIMIFGMCEAWFTGKKLADYFGPKTDFVNARRIINGMDCAAQIALYGEHFLEALKAGSWS